MKPASLDDFYAHFTADLGLAPQALLPPDIQREVGHFNIFNVADLHPRPGQKPTMPYERRVYYKISLIQGRSQAEYADKVVDIDEQALLFATPQIPYYWQPLNPAPSGMFCIFTPDFLLPAKSGVVLEELPLFRPGNCPVFRLSVADCTAVGTIFQKMAAAINSSYAFKYDLLRTYVLELIHFGQQLEPATTRPAAVATAAGRVSALFAELLERQFPLATPQQRLRLRTAQDFADQLAVHVNHLNKVLKETTGCTTTGLIAHRVAQEARLLLRHTRWSVAEIAESLGFADPAHFTNFFKRQTSLAPLPFRQAKQPALD